MDGLKTKTTVPYPSVGADGGQSLSQKPNQSIAEGVAEHKPPERDLEEIDQTVRHQLNFISAQTIDTVLEAALNRQSEGISPIIGVIPEDLRNKPRKPEIRQ